MANDKNFVVKNGLTTQNIEFVDQIGSANNTITVSMLSNDTLAFSGDSGQLFSITDSQSGTIFAVNDISGVPSIEVDYDGTIRFAETFGNVLIGTDTDDGSNKLQVDGSASISETLTSNNVVVNGDLTVSGNVTYIDTTTLNIGDNIITLNQDETGSPTQDAGIEIERGSATNVSLIWNESLDQWTIGSQTLETNGLNITGHGSVIDSNGQWVGDPANLQGYTGSRGFTGSQGIQGFTGSQGVQGESGFTGSQGDQGIQGFTGSQGIQGPIGYTGSQGDQGIQGFTGSQGIQGFTGSQGDQGIQGPTGFTGSKGSIGYTGSKGNTGAQGPAGFTGSKGAQGTAGFTGSRGDQGFTGARGFTGSQGIQGAQGVQGPTGFTGSQGVQGVQGPTGFTGSQGNIGYTGSQGVQGPTGPTGSQGIQGEDGNFGGATFDYLFSTNTADSDPGSGKLKFNNITLSSASLMFIDDQDVNSTDIQTFLRTVDDSTSTIKGHFRISNRLNADDFALFTVSGINEVSGYFQVSCSYISGSATAFSNQEDVIITFARTGDRGDTGFTGSQGDTGATGFTGSIGPSVTLTAGSGLVGGGVLNQNRTVSHADTSTQGSVNNSGSTVIQDVTLDGFGHVTNLNSKNLSASDVGALGVNAKADDADKLDGLDSSQFLRSDTSDTMSGNLTATGLTLNTDAQIHGATVGRGGGAVFTNTAVGNGALSSNTTGSDNTANGYLSLRDNTTGDNNTANGYQALLFNTTGRDNTANGYQALRDNTTGDNNTANGRRALLFNTTGDNNTANGYQALFSNTTGSDNTANGYQALLFNTTGGDNTANGYRALRNNTTGDNNTANGYNALYNTTTGSDNTANGYLSLSNNTTGRDNTANGYLSLRDNTTGDNNIGIGYEAGRSNSPFEVTTQSDRIVMGNNNHTDAYIKVAWTVTSDARDKTEFAPVPHGLDFISALEPTEYQFRAGGRDSEQGDGKRRYGFLAQDVLALEGDNPVMVDAEDPENLKLKESQLIPILVNAVKELSAQVEELKAEINQLKET
jgi:hypothetical protein